MNVLIVGANGFIGRHLLRTLREDPELRVTGAGTSDGAVVSDTGMLAEGFRVPDGTDAVIYLSQSPWWRQGPDRYDHVLATNAGTPVRLASLAAAAGARRFLFASSGTVYAPALRALDEDAAVNRADWYGLSKLIAEDALSHLTDRLTVCSMRLFGVYGPEQRGRLLQNLAGRIASGAPVTLDRQPEDGTDRGLRLTMTHVDDLCGMIRRLLDADSLPSILNVASDQSATIAEIAEQLGRVIGQHPRFEPTGRVVSGNLVADTTRLRAIVSHDCLGVVQGISRLRPQDLVGSH